MYRAASVFISNDARGATQTVEPVSADYPYPNTAVSRIPLLIPTKGVEIGVRTTALRHLQSTFSLWYLRSASELQQDGDTGGTVASHRRAIAMAWNGPTTTRRSNIWLLILTLRIPELISPRWTRTTQRQIAQAGSGYPKRLAWWCHRGSRCTITNVFRGVCACVPLVHAI